VGGGGCKFAYGGKQDLSENTERWRPAVRWSVGRVLFTGVFRGEGRPRDGPLLGLECCMVGGGGRGVSSLSLSLRLLIPFQRRETHNHNRNPKPTKSVCLDSAVQAKVGQQHEYDYVGIGGRPRFFRAFALASAKQNESLRARKKRSPSAKRKSANCAFSSI
jgi:hypothetical protein